MRKKILNLMLVSVLLFCSFACNKNTNADSSLKLKRDDWAIDVKKAANDFLTLYSKDKTGEKNYVVFDFDNTCSIFDIEEQLMIYQLQYMAFAFSPKEIEEILSTGLVDMDKDLTNFGYGKGSYTDWIYDIKVAYENLYNMYGPFTAKGVSEEVKVKLSTDDNWREFATKTRNLYDLIGENDSAKIAYPWILYLYTGMTEEEVYNLAKRSHDYYSNVETSKVEWTSPESIKSRVGVTKYTWTSGIKVSENIKELFKALDESGIDVWICSASGVEVVRAAVDAFLLSDYVTGLIGMTIKLDDGKFVNEYDYETGTYYLCKGGWRKGDKFIKAQPQGIGKVISISNTCSEIYGKGPIAGFMDSTGDFNFCTEYDSLKFVICFNRASRKVTDGGGVITEIAMYEKDTLKYDLRTANDNGDTLYVLQGRDENGMRSLRKSNKTLVYGVAEEKLFKNEDNQKQLDYMIKNNMKVKDAIDTFAIKTSADDKNNYLGFKYGFLDEYAGYHSRKK